VRHKSEQHVHEIHGLIGKLSIWRTGEQAT